MHAFKALVEPGKGERAEVPPEERSQQEVVSLLTLASNPKKNRHRLAE
ncbi:MAG: hypothetical protein GY842_02530 [bacterium]|nr:hypothetical protein [bacterium]